MKTIQSLDEANQILTAFIPDSAAEAYTLGRIRQLMAFLGNPQNNLKIVHVAGTSGKTSTCYYVASLLKTAGFKVGLTVSPHVVAVNERIQINLEPMSESKFCQVLSDFLELIDKSRLQPTYFELLVALAYWQFDKQAVDYAVVEVGLGGLLDGTNVVDRADKLCIITDIGLDHVNILGDTLAKITEQKAGIIQPHNFVFSYRQADEVIAVLQARCDRQKAKLKLIEAEALDKTYDFLALFQRRNFNLAAVATSYLLQRDNHQPLNHNQQLQAAKVHIPARMEIFKVGQKTVILDGAHNAQKLRAFLASVKAAFLNEAVAALVSFAANRDYRLKDSLHELSEVVDRLLITAFENSQDVQHKSVEPRVIAKLAKTEDFKAIDLIEDPKKAFQTLLQQPEPVLLVTGSFYLLNHIRPLVLKLKSD